MSDDEADLQHVRRSKVVHYGALDEHGVPAENSDQLQNETANVQVFFLEFKNMRWLHEYKYF